MSHATIAAIATPPGVGGVGIIRVSGPLAWVVLRRVCPELAEPLEPWRLRLTRAFDPSRPGEALDDVLVVVMRAPRSYTGEDVAELHGHGGQANMRALLGAVCAAGARPASPGEFTQRAFLNGRLDLTQAEAVADVIHASNEAALRLARSHLEGALGRAIGALQAELVVAVTLTEAAIDFSGEEHVYQLDTAGLLGRIEGVSGELSRLLGTFDAGRQVREGVRVVILGRPNAGKSTLFNLLCGQERAIVTPIPGTTRDWLEELVVVEGVALRLVDTAGVRATDDEVERIGVARALAQAREADVVLWVIDGSAEEELPDARELAEVGGLSAAVLPVLNKADRGSCLVGEALAAVEAAAGRAALSVSLIDGRGQRALLGALGALGASRVRAVEGGAVITRQRHREALERAREALERARESAAAGMSHEFIALDLRVALDATGEVVGRVTTDDILNTIFREFCVGK